jgi:hypothetical protein
VCGATRKRSTAGVGVAFDFDGDGVVDALLGYPPSDDAYRCSDTITDDISCFGLYDAVVNDDGDGGESSVQFGERFAATCVDHNPFPSASNPKVVWTIEQFNAARTLAAPSATPLNDVPDSFAFGVAPVAVSLVDGVSQPSSLSQATLSVIVDFTTTTAGPTTTATGQLDATGASDSESSTSSADATQTGSSTVDPDASSTDASSTDLNDISSAPHRCSVGLVLTLVAATVAALNSEMH